MNITQSFFGLDARAIEASVLYAFIGFFLMIIFITLMDTILKLNFRKELLEDQNNALAILVAGLSIGIAIIIAAAIH